MLARLQGHVETRLRSMHARWPWLRPVAAMALLLGGTLFLLRALHGQMAALGAATIAIPVWNFPMFTLLATLTVLITAWLHAVIVAAFTTATPTNPIRLCYAYAVSQVARYVPGKVFGVILEAQMLSPALNLRQVIAGTLLQTFLAYAWAATVAVIVLGVLVTGSAWLCALAPLALVMLWLGQRNRWLNRLRERLGAGAIPTSTYTGVTHASRRSAWQSALLLVIQWIPFFGIWLLLVAPEHGIAAAAWLGASYLLASIGGSLFVLVPSGLVVREAAFLWLGGWYGLPAPSLMAWAVVIRFALTFADILAAPLLWIVLRLRGRP